MPQAGLAQIAFPEGPPGGAQIGGLEALFEAHSGPDPAQSQGHLNVPQAGLAQIALPEGPPGGAQIGPPEGLFWTPIWEGSRGLNHIDARLGAQCFLAILGPGRGPNRGSQRPKWAHSRAQI